MRRDGDEKAARISEAKMVAMRRKQYAQAQKREKQQEKVMNIAADGAHAVTDFLKHGFAGLNVGDLLNPKKKNDV